MEDMELMGASNKPRRLRSEAAEDEKHLLPKLNRHERLELLGRITTGAEGGVDFIVMMVLASGLASVGLLQGSTAMVIGAMLVAPLMGPLVGAGMGLVQGNRELYGRALKMAALGVITLPALVRSST